MSRDPRPVPHVWEGLQPRPAGSGSRPPDGGSGLKPLPPARRKRTAAAWLALVLLAMLLPVQAQQLAPIPPLDSPVIDTTGTLDPATEQALEARARALQQRKGSQLQVLMVPTTQPEDIAQYAVRAFDQYRLGRGEVDDGVLLVVAKDDRRARIEVGYGLEGAIPDAIAMRVIQEYLVPHFRQGDYAGGIDAATGALATLVDGEPLPEPMAGHAATHDGRRGGGTGSGWLFALVAAMIVAQVARAVLGRAPRPVRGIGSALAAGGIAWLLSSALLGVVGGLVGLFVGFASASPARVARHRGWGAYGTGIGTGIGLGGFGRGGFGGGGFGGGWGGGGGMSGGGGASGGW